MSDGMTDAAKQTRRAIEHWSNRTAREDLERRIRMDERKKVLDEVIKLLKEMHERKYDPRPSNRTDDGGMYNDGELNLISEILEDVKEFRKGEQR